MRLKLYKFDKVGHYVGDDTLVINLWYGEVGNYEVGDTLVINLCYHLQIQRSSTMARYIYWWENFWANQSISRNEHLIQETNIQMNTERSLTQVS